MRLNQRTSSLQQQTGSALVVAIFVIVVLGLLVSVLSKLIQTSSDSVVVEVQGNRAFMAAQSGMQRAMLLLYPLNPDDDPFNEADCDGGELKAYKAAEVASTTGQCEANVHCDSYAYSGAGQTETHYRLTSTGTCKADDTTTSRTVAIETRVTN